MCIRDSLVGGGNLQAVQQAIGHLHRDFPILVAGADPDVIGPLLVGGAGHGQHVAVGEGNLVKLLAVFCVLDVHLPVRGEGHLHLPVLHVQLHALDSVSYTHLDVYKRQGKARLTQGETRLHEEHQGSAHQHPNCVDRTECHTYQLFP